MTELRTYQREAVDSVRNYWSNGGGNPLVSMATGTGKSVIIGSLCQEVLAEYQDMRVLMLVHIRELVSQNAMALLRVWPQAPLGINSAGIGRRDHHSKILFANVQSVYRRAKQIGRRDLLLIDEADLVPREGEGMYRQLIETLQDEAPDLRVAGFTATPYRLDSGRLDEGDGRLFDDTVYDYDLARGVKDGWLCPLSSKGTATEIDITGVTRRGGEFVAGALEEAADKVDVIAGACNEMVERGQNRRSWLVFCSGVQHAVHVRDAMRARGVSCETVSGETPGGERDRIFNMFRAGKIQCLTGCMVFTTGFDVPQVDLIGMLRPTLSARLYVQTLGRGTRPVWPSGFNPNTATVEQRVQAIIGSSKPDCLVLDFSGNIRRLGPVDAVVVKSKKKDDGDKPERTDPDTVRAKLCPVCTTYNSLSTLQCVSCGFLWPEADPKHKAVADIEPVMSRDVEKWRKVDDVRLDRHEKYDSPLTMRVEYQCGVQVFKEWVCLQHKGPTRAKAEAWWRAMGGKAPEPKTVDEAMLRAAELDIPTHVSVARDGKWWRIIGCKVTRPDGRQVEIDDRYRVRPVQQEGVAA